MRILFFVPYTPTPVRTRPYNLIRALVRKGHEVTVATLWTSEEECREIARLKNKGVPVISRFISHGHSLRNCVAAIPGKLPLQAVYSWHPKFTETLKRTLRESAFDVVHVEHLRGARYGLALKADLIGRKSPPVVWDSVDCISHLFTQANRRSSDLKTRLITGVELPRTRRYEGRLVNKFDRVLVTSEADRSSLLELARSLRDSSHFPLVETKVSLLSNGVDLEYFRMQNVPRETMTLVFSGKMSYHANVASAKFLLEQVMPLVWRQRPDVKVQIVGKDPPASIRALGRDRRVRVTGFVDDLRFYLQRATAAVIPLVYGAGIQNKVLEAMACGTPVIANGRATAALSCKSDRDLVVAGEASEFSQKILAVLESPTYRTSIGQAGREYVEKNHSWDAVASKLEQVYVSCEGTVAETDAVEENRLRAISPA